jgi:peptide/nickel transport system permease protein
MTLPSGRALFAAIVLLLVVLAALWGWIAPPYDPMQPHIEDRLSPPSLQYWMGTDGFGRDVLSRFLSSALTSLVIASGSLAIALLLGCAIGGLAGYLGGWTDRILSTLIDSILAFPGILLALALAAVIGSGATGLILALGIALTPAVARQLRGTILSVRQADYVEASKVLGHGHIRILLRDVLPNSIAPVLVLSASLLSAAILTESALSFLGIGVPPPEPTWGNMLAEGRRFITTAPWLVIFPGLAITVLAFAINLGGDALRDRLDPRMRGERV